MKEKGITDAIEALAELNKGKIIATLTVYGPIAAEYKAEFEQLIAKYKDFCTYGGVVSPDDSVKTLKNYYMLLFPTYWKGEGMPGTIIDAFCAGVPVIARRWGYCDEMIEHQKTGFVYDFDKPEELKTWLEYVLKYPQEIYKMKKNCLLAGSNYIAQKVVPQICALLQEKQ